MRIEIVLYCLKKLKLVHIKVGDTIKCFIFSATSTFDTTYIIDL